MGCHKKSVLWELSASLCSRAACIKGLTLPFSHTDAHTRNSAQCKQWIADNSVEFESVGELAGCVG